MGNKYGKISSTPRKCNLSCLWGFISIFESHSTRKLLAERMHERASYPGTIYSNKNLSEAALKSTEVHDTKVFDGCTVVTSRLTTVKDLIEEEMSEEEASKTTDCNLIINHEMTKNLSDRLDSEQTKCKDTVKVYSVVTSLAALIVDLDRISRQHPDIFTEHKIDLCSTLANIGCRNYSSLDESDFQHTHMNSALQEEICVKVIALLGLKIDDLKLLGHGAIQSQEYMNALERLASNKEIVQNPNLSVSRLVQELQKLHSAEVSKVEKCGCLEGNIRGSCQIERSKSNKIFLKEKLLCLSKKKDKFMGKHVSKTRNTSKEISITVGLTPCTSRDDSDFLANMPCISSQSRHSKQREKDNEKFFSHFSFREIKRRLRYIIREDKKKQHFASRDDVPLRVPYWYDEASDDRESTITYVANQTHCIIGKACDTSAAVSKTEKKDKRKACQHKLEAEFTQDRRREILQAFPFDKELLSEKARKHLCEILDTTESRQYDLTHSQVTDFCEKMFHLPEYDQNYPTLGPHIINELICAPERLPSSAEPIDTTLVHISSLKESLKETLGSSVDANVEMPVIDLEEVDESLKLNKLFKKDENPATYRNSECGSSSECWREECRILPEQKKLIPSTSVKANPLIKSNFNPSEFLLDKQERPSPVSVFDPFYLEDDASPDRASTECHSFTAAAESTTTKPIYPHSQDDPVVIIATSDHTEFHGRTCLFEKETMTKYIRDVLVDLDSERWSSSEQLLILTSHGSYVEDPKLLYDGVKEALLEIKDKQSQFSPWVSFLKPAVRTILKEEDEMIQEVCKKIEKNLSSQIRSTLKEITRKDIRSATWMDLRLEMECTTAEASLLIFEEIMEEIILELACEVACTWENFSLLYK